MTALLTLLPHHLNSAGALHGSVSATIVDWAGGMAIASLGREKTGLSTDMHISFLSAAREGEVIWIKAEAKKLGATLGFTAVEIRKRDENGEVLISGLHTKYVKQR